MHKENERNLLYWLSLEITRRQETESVSILHLHGHFSTEQKIGFLAFSDVLV